MNATEPTVAALSRVLASYESVVVAFSGGVDSALVARVAHQVLGDRAVALIGVSDTLPPEELDLARKTAIEGGFPVVEAMAHELEREGYARNTGDRCYFCKTELFDIAEQERARRGFAVVADGTLLDDLVGHRPGLKAASEHAVRHPLVEAGLRKADVRALAKSLGMTVWDKPSFACLGSRFPVGTRVTDVKVRRVAAAETELRRLGFRQFRVRWHEVPRSVEGGDDVLARIEVDPSEIGLLASQSARESIVSVCKEAGFRWVTMDLVGYPSPEAPKTSEAGS